MIHMEISFYIFARLLIIFWTRALLSFNKVKYTFTLNSVTSKWKTATILAIVISTCSYHIWTLILPSSIHIVPWSWLKNLILNIGNKLLYQLIFSEVTLILRRYKSWLRKRLLSDVSIEFRLNWNHFVFAVVPRTHPRFLINYI